MRLVLKIVLLVVFAAVVLPAAQQPASGRDAALSGVVKDATTGEPIADAIVQLGRVGGSGSPTISQRQFTDAQGRFVFPNLQGGWDYQILAAKTGYFDGGFGAVGEYIYQSRTMTAIRLALGQWYSAANILLARPGSISGTVTDERGEPVIGVYVRVLRRIHVAGSAHLAVGQVTITDDRGMYRVGDLRPGQYVSMVPSVQSSAPVSASFATVLGVSDRFVESFRRSDGTFSDRPMIEVDAGTRVFVGGYPIPPPPAEGRRFGYGITFSGGPSLTQSAAILLEAGTDRTGVDIRLTPSPVSRISGVLQGPPDAVGGVALRLLPDGMEDVATGGEAGTALTTPDGSFTFVDVPAGNYTIEVPAALNQYTTGPMGAGILQQIPFPPGLQPRSIEARPLPGLDGIGFSAGNMLVKSFWARTPVLVGAQDLSNVIVSLRPVMRMRGRLMFEGLSSPPAAPAYISLESATGSAWNGQPTAGPSRDTPPGEFAIDGITPGLYLLRAQVYGWWVKSVMIGERESVHTPIDAAADDLSNVVVTFTNAVQSVSGVVTKANGDAADLAAVMLFPAEPDQWTRYGSTPTRIQSVLTRTDGAFSFRTTPAGDYYLVAVPAAQLNAWREPGFFPRAQGVATRLSLAWNETKTAALKLVEVR